MELAGPLGHSPPSYIALVEMGNFKHNIAINVETGDARGAFCKFLGKSAICLQNCPFCCAGVPEVTCLTTLMPPTSLNEEQVRKYPGSHSRKVALVLKAILKISFGSMSNNDLWLKRYSHYTN